jgi:hypothetical protein
MVLTQLPAAPRGCRASCTCAPSRRTADASHASSGRMRPVCSAHVSQGKGGGRAKRIAGFSLMEFMIVAAVMALGLGVIMLRSANASREQRRLDYVRGIQQWTDSVRNAYAENGTYTGASAADLRRFAPSTWQTSLTVLPRIGGLIVPSVVTYLGLPGGGVQLVHSTLPRVDCGSVAFDIQAELVTVTINTTALKSTSAGTFTRAQADTACNLSSNTLTGVFK